jgi:hypothetical protein
MVVLVDFVVFVAAILVVVAIVRHNRHVVPLRMRPYCCRHRATRPACRALAHEALSSSPVWRRNRHVVRLRTRPYRRRHRATRPACRVQAHDALLSSPVWRRDIRGFVVDFVDFVAVIVDIIAVLRRDVRGFVVNFVDFVAVIDVVIVIARRDVNMLCPRARGLVLRHSSFVVTDSCCRRRRCVMRYENAVRSRTMAKNSSCACARTNKNSSCACARTNKIARALPHDG